MNDKFIEDIAKYVLKYAKKYGIKVHSPIIAQAILESASGTSELAKNAHNYFGLKYREGRCKTSSGTYVKVGSEQNPDGSYVSSAMTWFKFPNMERGILGYFDFINIPNYSNLKGVTNPKTYLENIKADGYATSINYVDNLMSVINRYNLTCFDKEETTMSNSPLVSHTRISPNKSVPRNKEIDTITIHCVVGQCSAETIGNVFAPSSRQASSNYGVGFDGKIGMYCEEKDRSWCTSSASNDNRAITIEVASDTTHPYAVRPAAYEGLIDLLVDICKRNPKLNGGLTWSGNKGLIGQTSKQNMTVHRWFASKSCPGEYLYQLHDEIAEEVNKRLGVEEPYKPIKPDITKPAGVNGIIEVGDMVSIAPNATYYRTSTPVPTWVKNKRWEVDEVSGTRVVLGKSEDGKYDINSPVDSKFLLDGGEKPEKPIEPKPPLKPEPTPDELDDIKKGDVVELRANAKYTNGKNVPDWVEDKDWIVKSVTGNRVVLGKSFDGKNNINSPVDIKYCIKVDMELNFSPFLVRVDTDLLNVRKGAGTNFPTVLQVRLNEVYTIIAQDGDWGKLKSGAGWIHLGYTEKV